MSIKSKIRFLMAENKINSLSELQRKTGISRNVLNKLFHEVELAGITLGSLHKICQVFDIKLDQLIDFDLNDSTVILSPKGIHKKRIKED